MKFSKLNLKHTKKDSFEIGFDWILAENSPILLEFNLGPGGTYYPDCESTLGYALQYSVSKTNQHLIFDELMPQYTSNPDEFDRFIEQHKNQVVFKKNLIQLGKGVSILKKPLWEPDLIEEFVKGEHYIDFKGFPHAIVYRCNIICNANHKNLNLKPGKCIRKIASKTIDEEGAPDQIYKINLMSSEIKSFSEEATKSESKILYSNSIKAMKKFIEYSQINSWDARTMFPKNIILMNFHSEQKVLTKLNEKGYSPLDLMPKGYDTINFLKHAKCAKHGIDAFIFNRDFNYVFPDFTKSRLTISSKEIPYNNYFIQTDYQKDNLEEITEKIIKLYQSNRN